MAVRQRLASSPRPKLEQEGGGTGTGTFLTSLPYCQLCSGQMPTVGCMMNKEGDSPRAGTGTEPESGTPEG